MPSTHRWLPTGVTVPSCRRRGLVGWDGLSFTSKLWGQGYDFPTNETTCLLAVPLYCAASLLALGLGYPVLKTTAARFAMMGGMACDGVFLFALSASNVSTEHDLALVETSGLEE